MIDSMDAQDALVAVMIATSAADEMLSRTEMTSIIATIDLLPVFRGYDKGRIERVAETVSTLFDDENGVEELVALVGRSLPQRLLETAYALACDVAASDLKARQTELRFLQILRQDLDIDRLTAAAIERGARARHQRL